MSSYSLPCVCAGIGCWKLHQTKGKDFSNLLTEKRGWILFKLQQLTISLTPSITTNNRASQGNRIETKKCRVKHPNHEPTVNRYYQQHQETGIGKSRVNRELMWYIYIKNLLILDKLIIIAIYNLFPLEKSWEEKEMQRVQNCYP